MTSSKTKSYGAKLKQTADSQKQKFSSAKRGMPLNNIRDRASVDTRTLDEKHVAELAESISVLGLISPIAVDKQGRLLAGSHRRAAIALLKEESPEHFKKHFPGDNIPVRVFDFDSEAEPEQALFVESSENEVRKDYSKAEILAIAERLKDAGYTEVKGRPSKGQKALRPALSLIVGKSKRHLRHLLNESETLTQKGGDTSAFSKWEKAASLLERLAIDPEAAKIARTLRNAAKKLRELEQ